MKQKPGTKRSHGEKVVRDIRRATRKQYSAEAKIRIALDGLKGEDSIAELCRCEGIAQSLYYSWSKEFFEAGMSVVRDFGTDGCQLSRLRPHRLDPAMDKALCQQGLSATQPII